VAENLCGSSSSLYCSGIGKNCACAFVIGFIHRKLCLLRHDGVSLEGGGGAF
jgi:hypothetical protein